MFFTNPSERDFSSFLATHVNEEMAKKGESAEIRNFSGGIVGLFAEKTVRRTDLFFASYYHLVFIRKISQFLYNLLILIKVFIV